MEKYLGADIPKLGFGLMRLPKKDGEIDIEQTKQMVDTFLARGFTYFDTAYVYEGGKSEMAAKAALVDRYPREKFQLASKLPLWNVQDASEMETLFQTSLDRTGAGYFDFYLLHSLRADMVEKLDKLDAWGFILQKKAEGKIKHAGFSFHDSAEVLDKLLTAHPEMEFVQLQINYIDWDSESVQSRACYEVARKHGKPVIIMEPVKGGALATMTPTVQKLFKEVQPDLSIPSWAVRFAASLEGIVTVLSGMSNTAQLEDNTSYMQNFRPLNDSERAAIAKAVEIMNQTPTIPCTECRYCVDGCPMHINIPGIFRNVMNFVSVYGDEAQGKSRYARAVKDGGKASECLQCGACEAHCPQHITIIENLKEAAAKFE